MAVISGSILSSHGLGSHIRIIIFIFKSWLSSLGLYCHLTDLTVISRSWLAYTWYTGSWLAYHFWDCRVNNSSRRLFFKTSLENQKLYSVKCTGKFFFGFQDWQSFSRLVLKTERPVLKTKRHIVSIKLENLSLFIKTNCAPKLKIFKRMRFWDLIWDVRKFWLTSKM